MNTSRQTFRIAKRRARTECRFTSTLQPIHEQDPAEYCRDLVRARDYESFLTSHCYPKNLQNAYLALRAFYVELATVQDTVSQTMIGKMRMQFWRDAIRDIGYNRPPRHPVALALHQVSDHIDLPSYHVNRLINARDAELDVPTHLTVESLTSHAESTSSTFNYMILSLLSLHSNDTLAHAASHLGVSQTISTLLRSLPYHASKGRMIIPAEITAKHSINQEYIFRNLDSIDATAQKNLEDAVFEFATIANDHLITARDMFEEFGGQVPGMAMPLFLSAIPVVSYLQKLEQVNFNPFHIALRRKDWRLPWRIWRSNYKSMF